MRKITGVVRIPGNGPTTTAARVRIQILDISLADAPSEVIAEQQLSNVAIRPNGVVQFEIQADEVAPNRTLSLRAHVSLDGSAAFKAGDLLSTAHYPVPNAGTPPPLDILVAVI